MHSGSKTHSIDTLFSFLLLLIFCLFSLLLAGMGAAVYKNGAAHLNENYTSRTAVAYLAEKVRRHDRTDAVFLTEIEDLPAIAFRDTIEDEDFLTYVYFSDGALCELMLRAGRTPEIRLGTRLVELQSLDVHRAQTERSVPSEQTAQTERSVLSEQTAQTERSVPSEQTALSERSALPEQTALPESAVPSADSGALPAGTLLSVTAVGPQGDTLTELIPVLCGRKEPSA